MGYGGKFVERERARELRAQSWTLQEIADELGVAKGSVIRPGVFRELYGPDWQPMAEVLPAFSE